MRTVTVTFHQEMGTWWLESDDMPGYIAGGDSLEEVRSLLQEGLPIYFEDEAGPFEVIERFDSESTQA